MIEKQQQMCSSRKNPIQKERGNGYDPPLVDNMTSMNDVRSIYTYGCNEWVGRGGGGRLGH